MNESTRAREVRMMQIKKVMARHSKTDWFQIKSRDSKFADEYLLDRGANRAEQVLKDLGVKYENT